MNEKQNTWWLIAYDIACPRRLGRVYRYLCKHGVPVQYSIFVFNGSQKALQDILAGLESIIDTSKDDIRAWHLAPRTRIWTMGTQHLPDGVTLHDHNLPKLLRRVPAEPKLPKEVVDQWRNETRQRAWQDIFGAPT
jgi:CRISPR-associated protein Cas2